MDSNSGNSFNEIYTLFYRKSYLFVKSYIHDDMASEDIVSEALIKVWEEMKRKPVDSVPRYLFTILKNQSIDYLRHKAAMRGAHDAITKSLNRELEIRTATLESNDPNDIFSVEVQQIIETTLNSLPERTKEIFMISHFGNKSHKEIAKLYTISVKGVDYHIMQSVKALRTSLKDYLPFLGALAYIH